MGTNENGSAHCCALLVYLILIGTNGTDSGHCALLIYYQCNRIKAVSLKVTCLFVLTSITIMFFFILHLLLLVLLPF